MSRGSKITLVLTVAILSAVAAALLGYRVLTRTIQARLLAALGPEAEVGGVELGLRELRVNQLRVRGVGGADRLSVERIVVRPSLGSLLTREIRLTKIEIERPTVVVTIRPDGSVELPLGLPPGASMTEGPPVQVVISEIGVSEGRVDLIDRTVRGPPVRVRVERVDARLAQLSIPMRSEPSPLELQGVIRGRAAEGRVRIAGWIEPATQSGSAKATLRALDLTLLAPYLLKVQDATVDQGMLDLDLDVGVRQRKVNAPGLATLRDLQLGSGPGVLSTFLGLPRQAVVNLLKTRDGTIEIAFRLEGDLSDPRFSLQQSVAVAIVAGLGEQIGVSVRGVGSGVVELGRKGAEALGGAARGLGRGLEGVFEKKP